jgi:hypothetical protein
VERRGSAPLRELGDRLLDAGQEDPESRASADLALAPDVSSALLDDAVARREPEPGSLPALLRREERLEKPRLDLLGDPDARVADCHADVRTGLSGHVRAGKRLVQVGVGGLDRKDSAGRHRVAGVQDEIQDGLLDLPGVGLDLPEVGRLARLQLDVLAD